jgi:hypothetical protein
VFYSDGAQRERLSEMEREDPEKRTRDREQEKREKI